MDRVSDVSSRYTPRRRRRQGDPPSPHSVFPPRYNRVGPLGPRPHLARSLFSCNLAGISSAKWLPAWPARWRPPTCWAPTSASASASSARANAASRSCAKRWDATTSSASGAADVYGKRLEEAKRHRARRPRPYSRLPRPAGRQEHRRGAGRHAAAPALRAFHGRARRRQARLPGKDHGVHGGARQEDARGLPARRQAHRADRAPVDFHRAGGGRRQLPEPGADGEDHRHPRATCTGTRRTANRSGRGPCIPT